MMAADDTPASSELALLADLLAGSKEVVPYQHGDDVAMYCGKACKVAIQRVRALNHNDPQGRLSVHCSTRGCSCRYKVSDLPKRYRVTQEELADAAVKALPRLIKAAGWRQVPEPASSNPGSKLEQVGGPGATLTEDEIETLASDLAQPVHYGLQGCNATSKLPPTLCSTDPDERAGQRKFVGNVLRYALRHPEGKAAVERILAARAGLSPEAVREREAAAWDACHEKLCVDERLQSCEWPGHVNPYRRSVDQ